MSVVLLCAPVSVCAMTVPVWADEPAQEQIVEDRIVLEDEAEAIDEDIDGAEDEAAAAGEPVYQTKKFRVKVTGRLYQSGGSNEAYVKVTWSSKTTERDPAEIKIEKSLGKGEYQDYTSRFRLTKMEGDNYVITPVIYMSDVDETDIVLTDAGKYRITVVAAKPSEDAKTYKASTFFNVRSFPKRLHLNAEKTSEYGAVYFNKKTGGKNTFTYQIEDYAGDKNLLTKSSKACKMCAYVYDTDGNRLAKTTAAAKKGKVTFRLKKGFAVPENKVIEIRVGIKDFPGEQYNDKMYFTVNDKPAKVKTIALYYNGYVVENNTIDYSMKNHLSLNSFDANGESVPYNAIKYRSDNPARLSISSTGEITVHDKFNDFEAVITAVPIDGSKSKTVSTIIKVKNN